MSLSYKNKIYATLFVSFVLLLISILFGYQNIQKSTLMLKHLNHHQIELNYSINKFNYDIKKNQADILQAAMLDKDFSVIEESQKLNILRTNLTKLKEFQFENAELAQKFNKILAVIHTRISSYSSLNHLLMKTVHSTNKKDIEGLVFQINVLVNKVEKDTTTLIDIANEQQYQHILQVQKNNQNSAQILIFSFILAVFLVAFSIYKFNAVHKRLQKQLQQAQSVEDDLHEAKAKLRIYNQDLEAKISKKTEELHNKIYTHLLSNLPNRNKLLEDIRKYKFLYIAILNIDKFQSLNDVYGEETGNILIKMSADFLRESIQESSMSLYHIGGDEFAIVARDDESLTNPVFIENIETILRKFKAKHFIYEDKSFQFMMSAGLSFGGKQKMLAYADMALKDAKKRNIQLSIFNDDKELEKNHQADIECTKKLLYAFKNDCILSYFQPIVPIQDTSKATKYESLVRLRDQDGTIIPPFNFLKVAHTNRLYYKITRAVINNTLSVINEYSVPCSLNLSLNDIENEKSMNYFFEKLDQFDKNELLSVELLETEEFSNYQLVYDFCIKVRSYGVKVALDDFGSGYSNFSHILRLPIDYIKIDASLISNIDRDLSSQIMVETIVELAHKLNVYTIAEFVSSEEIFTTVKGLGVDYAQGFYLGKPLDINEYITLR